MSLTRFVCPLLSGQVDSELVIGCRRHTMKAFKNLLCLGWERKILAVWLLGLAVKRRG